MINHGQRLTYFSIFMLFTQFFLLPHQSGSIAAAILEKTRFSSFLRHGQTSICAKASANSISSTLQTMVAVWKLGRAAVCWSRRGRAPFTVATVENFPPDRTDHMRKHELGIEMVQGEDCLSQDDSREPTTADLAWTQSCLLLHTRPGVRRSCYLSQCVSMSWLHKYKKE